MEKVLRKCVEDNLGQFMHRNAIFLCERLCADFPSEVNLQLLARCYLNSNKVYAAYHALKGKQKAHSRYLFAMACFEMNHLSEAEAAMLPSNECAFEVSDVIQVPNGAAGHYLLGLIYKYTDRWKKSVEHFKAALSVDPLFWVAYEELCALGVTEGTAAFSDAAYFRVKQNHLCEESSPFRTDGENPTPDSCGPLLLQNVMFGKSEDVVGSSLKETSHDNHKANLSTGSACQSVDGNSNLSTYNTPPMPPPPSDIALLPPPAPHNILQTDANSMGGETLRRSMARDSRGEYATRKTWKVPGRFLSDSGLRRSARLAARSTGHTIVDIPRRERGKWSRVTVDSHSNDKAVASSSVSSQIGNRLNEQAIASTKSFNLANNDPAVESGILNTLELLRTFGEGYRLMCKYKPQEALDVFQKLSPSQYNTGWVLIQVGRAYFELVDYPKADHSFSLARRLSPYSLEGMDTYSTLLYHMNEEMNLSYLAQELISTDRLAPQSWCAMGNCYSLQNDHENALKCFRRAIQLNSRFTYAHTLCGHEHVALEEYDDGIKCYLSALRLDERHYNSWYGLGMVYLRQEQYELAEHHFDRASHINLHSSVIMCYLGITLHALKKSGEALLMLEKAIIADKKNPLARYHKALTLVSLQRPDLALKILEELKEHAPNESSIYALMGKIYKQQEMYDKAMLHFGIALDLKPPASDAAIIKAALENMLMPHDADEFEY